MARARAEQSSVHGGDPRDESLARNDRPCSFWLRPPSRPHSLPMLRHTVRFALLASSFALSSSGLAQQRADTAWSIEATHGPSRPFKATVDEGTWMSLD